MDYTLWDKGCILLSVTPSLGVARRQKLMDNYAMDELYLHVEEWTDELTELLDEDHYARLLKARQEDAVGKELEALDRLGAVALTWGGERYPACLNDLDQPPIALYAQGDLSLLATRTLAVVGTRNITRYGRDVTQNFVADLVTNGFCIVSGLARGVDSVAHRTALSYEKPTIGVLPCGLDVVYPAENKDLYAQMRDQALLVSEYPMGTHVQQFTFVERNRIIAALSLGVLVTEAGDKSGACLTVGHALELGRDVFVVPGNIYSKASIGANKLIKDMQGAIVTSSYDILEVYHVAVEQGPVTDMQLDIVETQIIEALQEGDKHIEELIKLTGLNVSELGPVLTKLELIGLLHKVAGNYYGI
ncbi:MAG: DNA-processing protein DprA [Clostridia bacterium]|nr:DNA-processing protein DprA [Clostridia bacterium]